MPEYPCSAIPPRILNNSFLDPESLRNLLILNLLVVAMAASAPLAVKVSAMPHAARLPIARLTGCMRQGITHCQNEQRRNDDNQNNIYETHRITFPL